MVYNAHMIRFRPHIYIYKVYFIKGHFCPPPPAPLRKGKGGGRGPPCAPLSGVPEYHPLKREYIVFQNFTGIEEDSLRAGFKATQFASLCQIYTYI